MNSGFIVWDASDPAGYRNWLDLWNRSPHREASSHPDYANLFKGERDQVLCACYQGEGGAVLYSFTLREVPGQGRERGLWTDITTPYGYGGPLAWDYASKEDLGALFWPSFAEWAKSQNVVTEFIRFGLFPEMYLPYPGETVRRSKNYVRSLDLDDESIFMSFDSKVRKNVKKARRSGLSVIIDDSGTYLSDFLNVYHGTMDRRGASEEYYFPKTFFEDIHANLQGSFVYAHVLHQGAVISSELVLVSKDTVYSFLGGTEQTAFDLRPNDYLKYEIILWAKSQGKQRLVLGGGANAGDGIERYKKSFAPEGAVDFFTGQRIFDTSAYHELVKRHLAGSANSPLSYSPTFFPLYRKEVCP